MSSTIARNSRLATRAILALTCAAALAAPMLAQDPSTPPAPPQHQGPEGPGGRGPEMQQRQLEHMTRALNLTPDQVSQVKAIQDEGHQQMMALHNDTTTPGPDKRAKMMSLRQAQVTKIKGILNDDQKLKFDQMMAKQREHHEDRRENHPGGDQTPPPPPPAA